MTARGASVLDTAAIARLRATPRFVRSIDERWTMPRSSTSLTVSSLQDHQSTTRSRPSFITASRSTPRVRSWARAESGDWDEMTRTPLAPALRPSARNVRANWSFSWPEGPWRMTLDPAGRPPWTIPSNPSMPVASRTMGSLFQGSCQAASDGEVGVPAHRLLERGLEDALRGVGPEALGADRPKVSVDVRHEFPEIIEPPFRARDHLVEHGLPEFLVVCREPVLHLRLDPGGPERPDAVEEVVEVGDVEVDHLSEGARVVGEVDLEPEVGGSKAVLMRSRVVGSSLDEAELGEPLQELRHGRDVDVERPG